MIVSEEIYDPAKVGMYSAADSSATRCLDSILDTNILLLARPRLREDQGTS